MAYNFQSTSFFDISLFKAFLQKDVNRSSFISSYLTSYSIPYTIVTIEDKKHIFVKYKSSAYSDDFKIKTLVAHYDRCANTEGANDNSASCFILMHFALFLLHYPKAHNIQIIFTDGEENGAQGVKEQGSYKLSLYLKKLNMNMGDIFVFDMCGRGNVLVLSQSGLLGRNKAYLHNLKLFHQKCCVYAQKSCPNSWISLPTAYSDNAGFIAAGFCAQVITVLPKNEALILQTALNDFKFTKKSKLIDVIIKNKPLDKDSFYKNIIPDTWQLMHTPYDIISTLTPEAFTITFQYLNTILHSR